MMGAGLKRQVCEDRAEYWLFLFTGTLEQQKGHIKHEPMIAQPNILANYLWNKLPFSIIKCQ
jgi:hypothetical protein